MKESMRTTAGGPLTSLLQDWCLPRRWSLVPGIGGLLQYQTSSGAPRTLSLPQCDPPPPSQAASKPLGSILNSQVPPQTHWIRIFLLARSHLIYTHSRVGRAVLWLPLFLPLFFLCSGFFYSPWRIVLSISDKEMPLQKTNKQTTSLCLFP